MKIDEFLDITQPIINKSNYLYLKTVTIRVVPVYKCYTSYSDIILKCDNDLKPLSIRDVSKVIFKNIDYCSNIYISFRSTLYNISSIRAGLLGIYISVKPLGRAYYDSTIFN